jgi:peroxiredoxin Q/BCP
MAATPATGSKAPDIQLPDQDGTLQKLADQRGKWVLVYFYPRDDTPGCTVEACGVRDAWKDFRAHGIEVFGISADSVKRHKKFADKFELPFTLLADEEKRVIRAFGAWGKKKFMGREFDGILRQSFLIDPSGKIAKVYPKVKPAEHAAEVLEDVLACPERHPSLTQGSAEASARESKVDGRESKEENCQAGREASEVNLRRVHAETSLTVGPGSKKRPTC